MLKTQDLARKILALVNESPMYEAFGQVPQNHQILPAVQALVKELNDLMNQSQDTHIANEVSKHRFDWQKGMSDEDAIARLSEFKQFITVKPKQKYILLDRTDNASHGSGLFMVDTADGMIYGVKAYGVPNKIRKYGTVDAPLLGHLAMVAAVTDRVEMMQLLAKRGIKAY